MTSEVQRRIDLLGELLGRSVVLNDNQVRTTHASRHFGDEDEVRIKGVLHRDGLGWPTDSEPRAAELRMTCRGT